MQTDTETASYLAMLGRLATHVAECDECRGMVPADYCPEGWFVYTAIPLEKRPPMKAGAPLPPPRDDADS